MSKQVNYTAPGYGVDRWLNDAMAEAKIKHLTMRLEEMNNQWRSLFETLEAGERCWITDEDTRRTIYFRAEPEESKQP